MKKVLIIVGLVAGSANGADRQLVLKAGQCYAKPESVGHLDSGIDPYIEILESDARRTVVTQCNPTMFGVLCLGVGVQATDTLVEEIKEEIKKAGLLESPCPVKKEPNK